jgi:glycosyltransferase involved in cell wall biosynthesis
VVIGMVGTRFAGLDGVTLETKKVAHVLEQAGHQLVWFAGELGPGFEPGIEFPEAHFSNETNQSIQARSFGSSIRPEGLADEIRRKAEAIKEALAGFVKDYSVDAVLVQAALAIPMQLSLGLAITELLDETGLPAVAHHHDFAWERERFRLTAVPDILDAAFPPRLDNLQHLVINSIAQEELARRRGIISTVLPNVMDFATEPQPGDARRFRRAARLDEGDIVLLQPTRPIPRKNIEATLDLAFELADDRVKVIVTHPEHDEGSAYWRFLEVRAERLGVDLRSVPATGGEHPDLADAYAAASLVTFPSLVEGFGNALLETFYFRRPVLVNRYPVYSRDIAPTGVQCIEIDGQLTPEAVQAAASWIANPTAAREAVEANFEIGLARFSYRVLHERLVPLLDANA